MKTIPMRMLACACAEQRKLAKRAWPRGGIPLTKESVEKAMELGLDILWLAAEVLRRDEYDVFYEKTKRHRHLWSRAVYRSSGEDRAHRAWQRGAGLVLLKLLLARKET